MSPEHPHVPHDAHGEPLGLKLRQAREGQGMRVEDVARQLRLPKRVIELIEASDWERLGNGIHLRGQLLSYARLVDVPREAVDAQYGPRPQAEPQLVAMAQTSRLRRSLDRSARKFVYVAITAVLALPVWLGTREHLAGRDLALTPLDRTPTELDAGDAPSRPADAGSDPQLRQPPLLASLTPGYQRNPAPPSLLVPAESAAGDADASGARQSEADGDGLVLRASGESWVEVVGHDGQRLEHGILQPGTSRQFSAGDVAHVTLGNAQAVEVLNGGETVDLAPYRRAQVARFTMSPDGVVAPSNR